MSNQIHHFNNFYKISYIFFINRTPLFDAVDKENIEIIKLLLSSDKLSINEISVFDLLFRHDIQINLFFYVI